MEAIASHPIYSTVPSTNHLGLFGATEPNLKKAVAFLKLKKEDIASATGVPPGLCALRQPHPG